MPIPLLLATPAFALSLSLQSESSPFPGVTFRQYRTSSPSTDTWVLLTDLCTDYVHIDATKAPTGYASTGSWASSRGVQAATNGDFYTSGPQVYGDAVGEGVRWPADQTGTYSGYSSEWYYDHYGWIAFLQDEVTFTHTEWVKLNRTVSEGWEPEAVSPAPPPGTIALVSGFPELVIEGAQYTCTSPTDSSCFPDRSDMRARHPRTAMGLTEDRQTFILAVVDGRTSSSAGMYGAELADLMHQLGAWEAFNLDGGGSSQMWISGRGYVNDYDGNNNGGGARSVTNHWGVFAGSGSGMPQRPGHCAAEAPCGTIPAAGGIIDDGDACFQLFGNPDTWRPVSAGYGGHLYWTNVWNTDQVDNWVWWRLHLERAGTYEVEVYAEADYSLYDHTHYEVVASGQTHVLDVDVSGADGWLSLGSFDFAAGGAQWVALYDDHDGSVASGMHVPADALRLTRVGSGDDTGLPDDTADPTDDTQAPDDSGDRHGDSATPDSAPWPPGERARMVDEATCGGCGAGGGGAFSALLALLGLAWCRRSSKNSTPSSTLRRS
ncbi:MAG: phosphodiester glycosidase family protein [Pseudomonadota bacterium]